MNREANKKQKCFLEEFKRWNFVFHLEYNWKLFTAALQKKSSDNQIQGVSQWSKDHFEFSLIKHLLN